MQVKANVYSNEMEILSDANVVEVGTNNRTTTDATGRFIINVKDANAQLKISHVGYDYDTFPVNSGEIKTLGYVSLFPNATIEEVVISHGSNNNPKSDNTGLWVVAGIIAAIAAFKLLGKSKPQPRKVKV